MLGCGIWGDRPSPMLADRLERSIELYQAGVAPKLLMSGDHGGKDYNEVDAMKQYAVDAGIGSENVFMDHAGFSTYDSVYRAKAIFGVQNPLIVTQEYHSYRALMIANHLGLDATAVTAPILSADVKVYPKQTWYSFRETVARVKDFFYSLAKPEPTFLGEPISLQSGGNLTNDETNS